MTDIRPLDQTMIADLGGLLATDKGSAGCWCMWFIIRVRDYHAAGSAGNEASLRTLAARSTQPMGLLAYRDGEPVGWCAVGPRSRYSRAIATPTFKGRNPAEDDAVWLLPCLFVRKDARKLGLSEKLVRAAVRLAGERGAKAVEAFPHLGHERRSSDLQVGFEPIFSRCGFEVVRQPSPSRAVMRLDIVR
jgi:GNAT superfamily N-acetyltransferase